MEERGSNGKEIAFFIFGERLFSGSKALPEKINFLDFVKWFFLWSVAPPGRGGGGGETTPPKPPAPPQTPQKTPR